MKPKSWRDCPAEVFERFLWDLDLEYCHWESSKAERIHEILNGTIYEDNERIINSAWSILSEDEFRQRCQNVFDYHSFQINRLKEYL